MKAFRALAIALMVVLTVSIPVYCIPQMIEHPYMLDVKIAYCAVATLMSGMVTWFLCIDKD